DDEVLGTQDRRIGVRGSGPAIVLDTPRPCKQFPSSETVTRRRARGAAAGVSKNQREARPMLTAVPSTAGRSRLRRAGEAVEWLGRGTTPRETNYTPARALVRR